MIKAAFVATMSTYGMNANRIPWIFENLETILEVVEVVYLSTFDSSSYRIPCVHVAERWRLGAVAVVCVGPAVISELVWI